jgi:predicted DNA-binding transcriptional regulator
MKTFLSNNYIYSHKGENRYARRFNRQLCRRFKKRGRKSYFVISNEVIEMYRCRDISAVDVTVYAVLCSFRREYDGVRVSQERIAHLSGIKSRKTISASVERLYRRGLIKNVIIETAKHWKKYKTSIYHLKQLPNSGYFFAPRHIFMQTCINPKMFALYFFMCRARSCEYEKSWNSYNDICRRLGYGKNQRSEIVKIIGELTATGLLKKTVRRIKGVFVDNIYRVAVFIESAVSAVQKKKMRPSDTGTHLLHKNSSTTIKKSDSVIILSYNCKDVKPLYVQGRLDLQTIYCQNALLL